MTTVTPESLEALIGVLNSMPAVLSVIGIAAGNPFTAAAVAILTVVMRALECIKLWAPAPKHSMASRVEDYARRSGQRVGQEALDFFPRYDAFVAVYDEVRGKVGDLARGVMMRNTVIATALCGGAIPDLDMLPDFAWRGVASNVDILDPIQVSIAFALAVMSPVKNVSAKYAGDASILNLLDGLRTKYDAIALFYIRRDLAPALFGAGALPQEHFERVQTYIREVRAVTPPALPAPKPKKPRTPFFPKPPKRT